MSAKSCNDLGHSSALAWAKWVEGLGFERFRAEGLGFFLGGGG